jgi:MFS family permease
VNLQPDRADRSTTAVAASTGLAAIVFILITVLLDTLAGSIVGPVMPALLKSLTGGAMAQMSTVYGAMMVIFATMQLVMGPVQGALSDRFGRRPVILLSTNLIVQTGLVAKAIRVFGERGALLAGMTVQIVGIAAAGLAPTGWLFTAAVVFLVVGGVAEPARMSIINRVIGPSDRGPT